MVHPLKSAPPAVSVEVVIFALRAGDLAVLLVHRDDAPFAKHWSLPGDTVSFTETLERSAQRILADRTGISGVTLEQLGAFGDPGRDERGHAVAIVYFTFVVAESHPVSEGSDREEIAWIPLRELASHGVSAPQSTKRLAFDHGTLIARARQRLQERLNDPSRKAGFELVPPRFTLTELQRVYEAVFGRVLDKRNFRARLFAHQLVEPVATAIRTGRHRPAQLYRWRQPKRGR